MREARCYNLEHQRILQLPVLGSRGNGGTCLATAEEVPTDGGN